MTVEWVICAPKCKINEEREDDIILENVREEEKNGEGDDIILENVREDEEEKDKNKDESSKQRKQR